MRIDESEDEESEDEETRRRIITIVFRFVPQIEPTPPAR
jgi:hypothetical protein